MNIFRILLEYIFPENCISCGTEGKVVCSKCIKKIIYKKAQECPNCRQANLDGKLCKTQCLRNFFFDQLLVATSYKKNFLIQGLIKQYKYRNKKGLSLFFSKMLFEKFKYDFFKKINIGNLILVSVPISKDKLKVRAYNQCELIAKDLSKKLQTKHINALKWTNYQGQQAGLSKAQRINSRSFTMDIRPSYIKDITKKNIILIDDIASTCSTINECSRVLKHYGAQSICVVVISRN